jgi:hypothetical protein
MPRRSELARHAFDFALVEPTTNRIEIDLHKAF